MKRDNVYSSKIEIGERNEYQIIVF